MGEPQNLFHDIKAIERNRDHVKLSISFPEIATLIKDTSLPIVIRNLLSLDEAIQIRSYAKAFATHNVLSNPKIDVGCKNFHRIDYNNEKSNVKSILHGYASFYWNEETNEIAPLFKRVMSVRNQLSGLAPDYATIKDEDGLISIPAIQHYPRGGGWMQEHKDPDIGQKVVLSTVLSKMGIDYDEGGLFYINERGKKEFVDQHLEPGDSFLFNPKVKHGVAPIDPNEKLNWERDDGRWMMFSALVTISSLQGQDDSTAGLTSGNDA